LLTHACARLTRVPALLLLLLSLTASLLVTAAPASAAPTLGQRAVEEAARHKGKPYQYGATGPSRFDCSGFTLYVFSRFGKSLPHSSSQQYAKVHKVAKTQKQVGDLLFMKNSSGRITHVGIWAGSGKWWVAPKSGDVVKLQTVYSSNYVVGRVT
jgi:cell wall-associated NlpC family hydrolase